MLHKSRRRDSGIAAAPKPSFMSKEQMTDYLTDLRSNRVARPSGSRPQPSRKSIALTAPITNGPSSATSGSRKVSPTYTYSSSGGDSNLGVDPQLRSQSAMSGVSSRSSSGAHAVDHVSGARTSMSSTRTSSAELKLKYAERGQRWMEKQEARSLREALQAMDMQEDPQLYASAHDEASELVRQHQKHGLNPKNPAAPRRFTEHLRRGSHARSQSIADYHQPDEVADPMVNQRQGPKLSDTVVPEIPENESFVEEPALEISGIPTLPSRMGPKEPLEQVNGRVHALWDSPEKKAYMNLTFPTQPTDLMRRTSGARRSISGGKGKGLFRNPEDQIYEEPEDDPFGPVTGGPQKSALPTPLGSKFRNSLVKVRPSHVSPTRSNTAPVSASEKLAKHEFPKAPIRAAAYTTNPRLRTPSVPGAEDIPRQSIESGPPMKDGKEIRGDDIREATSMKRSDRSPRLPSPAFISDSKNRPIVSFDSGWHPKDPQDIASLQRERPAMGSNAFSQPSRRSAPAEIRAGSPSPSARQIESPRPPIPTINVPDIPTISVGAPRVSEERTSSKVPPPRSSARVSATPKEFAGRPLPHHSASAPAATNTPRYSASTRKPTASCTQCQLPISGRIVSAAGERFHPECFSCFHCGEGLECVAFYPEPEDKRDERVDRIRRREGGEHLEEVEGRGQAEDGDEALRFYCHLDFHEFFSPRCRNCKTPIEGEVILACGGEWHAGHFFCAQCGDPFDASTPFVEKEGYAWCINCHTNRFSNKCKKCRKPVTDMVVQALGSEWHAACFCCEECGGDFENGQYFLRGNDEIPVCVRCEERRLKA